jgi:hypothetical protein
MSLPCWTTARFTGTRRGGAEDGEVYALITVMPGANGEGAVASFPGNLNPGTLVAVRSFTDPRLAAGIVSKLRDRSGRIPKFFQLALRVRFKGRVPIETTYVLHRVLHARSNGASR